jgi:hypothetical protein
MVVDPSDQDGFWGKLLDVLELFTFLSESPNLRSFLQRDGLGDDKSKSLPNEGKDKMRSLLDEILWSDTDEFDAIGFGGCETHLKILVDLIDVHVCFGVDSTGIDAVLIKLKHEFVDQNTVVENMEQGIIFRIHRQSVSKVLIILDENIDNKTEGVPFFDRVGVNSVVVFILKGCFTSFRDLTELIRVGLLKANHHGLEFFPADNSIPVAVILGKDLLDLILGHFLAHINHDLTEFSLWNSSIGVCIIMLE